MDKSRGSVDKMDENRRASYVYRGMGVFLPNTHTQGSYRVAGSIGAQKTIRENELCQKNAGVRHPIVFHWSYV